MGREALPISVTRRVAELARLELTEEEVQLFTSQLGEILGYVDQLKEVDVSSVEPLTQPAYLVSRLRKDVASLTPLSDEGHPKSLQGAPDVLNDGFKVPPIL